MGIGTGGPFGMWTQDEFGKPVLVVHHVEKRKARVNTRSGQHLKEGFVACAVGIAVAGAVGIASTKAGFEFELWLNSGFDGQGSGASIEYSPVAKLPRSRLHQIS